MTEENLFREKAAAGYVVCSAEQCPMKTHCLRWLVGQQMPDTTMSYSCVNLRYQGVATEQCPLYRNSEPARFARGMTHIFNGDMPRRLETSMRRRLIAHYGRTYFYEYRNGKRIIPPKMQQDVRRLFLEAGWKGNIEFDSYFEDYEWK